MPRLNIVAAILLLVMFLPLQTRASVTTPAVHNVESDGIKEDGACFATFLVAYADFRELKALTPAQRDLSHYRIGICRKEGANYDVDFFPKQTPGAQGHPVSCSRSLGRGVGYLVQASTATIIRRLIDFECG